MPITTHDLKELSKLEIAEAINMLQARNRSRARKNRKLQGEVDDLTDELKGCASHLERCQEDNAFLRKRHYELLDEMGGFVGELAQIYNRIPSQFHGKVDGKDWDHREPRMSLEKYLTHLESRDSDIKEKSALMFDQLAEINRLVPRSLKQKEDSVIEEPLKNVTRFIEYLEKERDDLRARLASIHAAAQGPVPGCDACDKASSR